MLSDLDETVRQILVQAGGYDPSEVEVSFEIPNREWSAGISKPTLNCYLFDIRENKELRQHGMETMSQGGRPGYRQRPLSYFDLTYLVTAWTRQVEDEHRLLWHTLQTLLRFERLPEQYLQGALRASETPIYARTAMSEGVLKSPGEFWTALDNQIKPSISYVVTLSLDRERISVGPPVTTARFRFPGDSGRSEESWGWFGGIVRGSGGAPLAGASVSIAERGYQTTTDQEGRFRLRIPGPGSYTLVARSGDQTQQHKVTIPEHSYDFALGTDAGPPAKEP